MAQALTPPLLSPQVSVCASSSEGLLGSVLRPGSRCALVEGG